MILKNAKFQPGFNVRSYGVLTAENEHREKFVLLSRETINGSDLIKFPGGGIEFKEGPGAAVAREFWEELKLKVEVDRIFYVSPHFHSSYFRPQQFIALYWRVRAQEPLELNQAFSALTEGERRQQGFWQKLKDLSPLTLNHPSDREVVAELLKSL